MDLYNFVRLVTRPGTIPRNGARHATLVSMAPRQRGEVTILLAEDEPLVRTLIRNVLTAGGYTVLDAADGQEALELSRNYTGEIHMLVTDVRMPRMTGVELVKKLRSERPGIRVLVMSAEGSGLLAQIGKSKDFIRKPFLMKALLDKVGEILAR
jgi:two-component system cell cycle sensor histidine kinase/response regulator CckA